MHHRLEEDRQHRPLVWVMHEKVVGVAIQLNAHYAQVSYTAGGLGYEELLDDEDYLLLDDNYEYDEECV